MTTLQQYIDERLLSDPEFKRGYDRLGPLYSLITEVIRLRLDQGLTQKEIAERMGKQQPAIARFEAGNTVPTLTFLQDISEALGARLVVRIEAAETSVERETVAPKAALTPSRRRKKQAVKA